MPRRSTLPRQRRSASGTRPVRSGTGYSDGDGDGAPDGCDPCPIDNPDDSDGDGVCDSADVCPGGDDRSDTDGDGVPDACDDCPLDNPDDRDADGVCDSDDGCPDDPDKTEPGACGCSIPEGFCPGGSDTWIFPETGDPRVAAGSPPRYYWRDGDYVEGTS